MHAEVQKIETRCQFSVYNMVNDILKVKVHDRLQNH
jgi:hypothetical protein